MAISGTRLRVLLVEDRPADAELNVRELRRAGYETEWMRVEAEPAYRAQLDRDWDLILAECSLPTFSGLRALELLRETGRDTPFIVVSGTIDEEAAVELMRAGAHDYVMKGRLQRLGLAVEREMRVARDRAERGHAMERLRASERRYSLLAEAAHDVITLVTREGVIEYANSFAAHQFGVPVKDMVGRTLADLLPAELAREKHDSIRHVLDSAEPRYLESKSVFKQGDVWLGSWVVPVCDEPGKPPETVLIVARDITASRRVAQSHAMLVKAVEHAGEAIVVTDADGRIEYVNPAFETVSGYRSGEVVGQNPRILKSERHDGEFFRQMWSALGAGNTWHGRVTNKRKDGTLYEEEMTISPVRSGSDRISHYVAVKRDVTEARAMQAQFYQAQKMESVGRLAGGIAHDFNNLLTVINGTCDLVLDELVDGGRLHSDLTQVRISGERAAGLTRQLLAFSRRQVMQRRVVSLAAVASDLEPMLRRLIGEDVAITVSPEETAGHVRADPGQLEQVLINLVVNARDAMPKGGSLNIEVTSVELDADLAATVGHEVLAGPYVVLAVSDSGTGMDEATKARLFEPFFTTKAPGYGTGLGLSTVYGIVKQNEGYIQVSSEVGRGTTFSIYLPRVMASLEPAPIMPAGRPGGTETILLVEDEEDLAYLAVKMLTRAGYTVLTALSGSEALEILGSHPGQVALVITDIVMPLMSGPMLKSECQRLRPGIKVLFMSGYTADVVLRHGVDEGMPFLHKPFSAAQLTQAVRHALDRAAFIAPAS
jgi:two-component system, cell cycle sensor histidine kinase and response regulator CckA